MTETQSEIESNVASFKSIDKTTNHHYSIVRIPGKQFFKPEDGRNACKAKPCFDDRAKAWAVSAERVIAINSVLLNEKSETWKIPTFSWTMDILLIWNEENDDGCKHARIYTVPYHKETVVDYYDSENEKSKFEKKYGNENSESNRLEVFKENDSVLFKKLADEETSRLLKMMNDSEDDLSKKNVPRVFWGYLCANGGYIAGDRIGVLYDRKEFAVDTIMQLKTAKVFRVDSQYDTVVLTVDLRDSKTIKRYIGDSLSKGELKSLQDETKLRYAEEV